MNAYKANFDTLGNRIEQAQDSYIFELIDLMLFVAFISIPFVVWMFT